MHKVETLSKRFCHNCEEEQHVDLEMYVTHIDESADDEISSVLVEVDEICSVCGDTTAEGREHINLV